MFVLTKHWSIWLKTLVVKMTQHLFWLVQLIETVYLLLDQMLHLVNKTKMDTSSKKKQGFSQNGYSILF
jgi:hypothetical protein